MPATADYLAIDLGASSGRAVLGAFDGARLSLREVHRFANGPIELPTGLHWDAHRLFGEVKHALSQTRRAGVTLAGVGIDTWGVDYALLSAAGEMLGPPHHYRDPRTRGMMAQAFRAAPRERIYSRTGIQFMALNTLYQLLADQRAADAQLSAAASLLFTPDLLNYWLTGIQRSEHTIASTSQLFDTAERAWATDLIDALSLPRSIFPQAAPAGTVLGPICAEIARETGVRAPVIAPASHDTASAVAAVPVIGNRNDWAYVSSGTWSLVGREIPAPIRTPQALAANFTNECGMQNTIRFHKNIAGLWILQECQREWESHGRPYTFEELHALAAAAPPLAALIDPDDPPFSEFGDMPAKIRAFCRRTRQPPPDSDGAMTRCILESLALRTRAVLGTLESLTGRVATIHLVGGGAHNPLLCQFTANAAARPLLAGPIEATAAGNLMCQAFAHGRASSLQEIRAVIAASFRPIRYEPQDHHAWSEANGRFQHLDASPAWPLPFRGA
ncbi:rhamnulokinase [Phycisphaerales bacterium]|nr:rhamnulokinase [Phycisphaerales bacterium]